MRSGIAPRSDEVCDAIESRKGFDYAKTVCALSALQSIVRSPILPLPVVNVAAQMVEHLIKVTGVEQGDLDAYDKASASDVRDIAKRLRG